jgi:type VI secretion system protein ImpA
MAPLDLTHWLDEIPGDSPTGVNLELDPDFGKLERAAQSKPERQYGNTIVPAEEPDWKDVAAQASALLERSRDLRVFVHLAIARLHIDGLPAFAEILSLIRQVLETRWDEVHPRLDPEEDNDPTLRANSLARLADGRVLKFIRDLPLAQSRGAGKVAWRDIEAATSARDGEADEKTLSEATIRGIFGETDQAALADLNAATATIEREAIAIPAVFDERTGYGNGPELEKLSKLAHDIHQYAARHVSAVAAPEQAAPQPAGAPAQPSATALPARADGASATSLTAVTTRADALHLLDLVCRYYERYEPSSPLPLLIDRARRLAEKNFIDILRDLAPEGVGQAQLVVGQSDV